MIELGTGSGRWAVEAVEVVGQWGGGGGEGGGGGSGAVRRWGGGR